MENKEDKPMVVYIKGVEMEIDAFNPDELDDLRMPLTKLLPRSKGLKRKESVGRNQEAVREHY